MTKQTTIVVTGALRVKVSEYLGKLCFLAHLYESTGRVIAVTTMSVLFQVFFF